MHQTAVSIVEVFRRAGAVLSTTQLLQAVNEHETKPKLRRKMLYHLNCLVKKGVLRVAKHGPKGEKYFALNLQDNEELVELTSSYVRRVIASQSTLPATPMEGYESQGITKRFEPETWLERCNAFALFANNHDSYQKLLTFMTTNLNHLTNDALLITKLENHINRKDPKEFISALAELSEQYGKKITIDITLENITNKAHYDTLIITLAKLTTKNITLIVGVSEQSLHTHALELASQIVLCLSKKNMLYIRNHTIHPTPYIIGKAGPYSLDPLRWHALFSENNSLQAISCAQTTVIVDVGAFFEHYGYNIEKFTNLMVSTATSILIANSYQRRNLSERFQAIETEQFDPLELSQNYIRLWNFGLFQHALDPEKIITMIVEAKKKIDLFTRAEETIYRSCGMAANFKIAFAPAFASAATLSKAHYPRLEITATRDFENKTVRKALKARQSLSKLFDGGDEITLHYTGERNPEEIFKQCKTLIEGRKIPLFNYSFTGITGDLKLTDFL